MVFKLQIKVFFIWATLWFSVRGSGTDSDGKEVRVNEKGDGKHLICGDEELLPSVVTWIKHGSNKNLHNETTEEVQNGTKTNTSSILNVTAEHFEQYTCTPTAQRQNNTLTEVDITVIYVKKPEISSKTTTTVVKPAEGLNLTCMADGVPPSVITWTQNNSVLQNDSRSLTVTIQNYTGPYTCTAKPTNNTEDKEEHNGTVNSISEPQIIGNTTVKEGESLNLTCSAEGFDLITWAKVDSTKNLSSRTYPSVKNRITLFISNVTAEDSGQYICRAKFPNKTVTVDVNVTVILPPKILNSSGCTYHLESLTCTCISEDDPLPTIRWPLLDKQSSYIIINTVVNNTVNSTFTLSVKEHSNTTVQCVHSNGYWEIEEQLNITNKRGEEEQEQEQEDPKMKMFRRVIRLEIILAFLTGILLSACICCLTRKCCRKKQKDSGYLAETLELVTSQQHPLVDPEFAEENTQSLHHPEAEAEEAAKSDIEYSNIDFSALPRNGAMGAERVQNNTNTDYAEIKKDKRREERHEGEEEEITNHRRTEEEDEDANLYSNVKDVMDQM
ncbi:hemicentin-1-like [Sphaeramia orbicularis]|uniref:Hemicentin-1-like n=1 Tax=Sphaeramia orbicularis TaxID=375764 RepID=A0A673A4B3_9TELE|nr:hemicentin-1-like [Sphaeramia orbicularis]XP_030012834.1 hemicentin-1-like [Sphaeramia orbicularis]